jgi:pimeloyl-ACP methyl ester carboxylesterase
MILYEPVVPDGSWSFDQEFMDRFTELVDQGQNEAALESFMRVVVKMPEHELARYRQLPMWQRRVALVATIPREETIDSTYRFEPKRFIQLNTPTLLLKGGDSPEFFHKSTAVLDQTLPNSKVVVIPGQQHIAMDLVPEMFVREVRNFLSDIG